LDADFWAARMAYLARLAHTEGLAVVLQISDEGYVTYVAHNLAGAPEWGSPSLGPLFARVFGERAAVEQAVAMPLADGRTAERLYRAPGHLEGPARRRARRPCGSTAGSDRTMSPR